MRDVVCSCRVGVLRCAMLIAVVELGFGDASAGGEDIFVTKNLP
jgi:hypothetical protein